ncbi:MAG: cysteine desulfurase [Gammaproteobacteria bacterium]|nr:cysteine desulfurase [Rhodocyclaceae bacterium]MBU3908670.1 cysteine desulfurase [Gammaproteobacteria bacterium]MBU3988965.1 cysteine desulfurase [Gammaproteobacteria bacterium]MBU4004698.1 cysteine desulfurase [Gammaproteobacteria bacterium]MBU4021301.1 cysteine desulfurase [Gammaproteobacteria bacterium]
MNFPIYLDYNATTPVAPEVAAVIRPWLEQHFGNPSSSHVYGQQARQAVAQARNHVAALIGSDDAEIVFTGGATEANNLALLGVARAYHALGDKKRHLVISAIEHPAVMQPALHLRELGWEVTVLPVDSAGRVAVKDLAAVLRPDTALVSVMHANNEVGTLQPLTEIAALARANGTLVHTDAAQSAGKLSVNVDALGIDLLTLAFHKFYGPKGIGALYVRRGTPLKPILFGADQEHGQRPGTENVALIVGAGETARLARERLPGATQHLASVRDELHRRLAGAVPGLMLNGHPDHRLPNTLHVSFPGVSGRELLAAVADEIAASVGSACHSEADAVSGVLAAMGCNAARARGAVRLSVGLATSEQDVIHASSALADAWKKLSIR